MGRRAKPSGVYLTVDDASIAKAMLIRGDRQHDVAAWFGVNGGRIAEISTGATFRDVAPASPESLPPPGPYPGARVAVAAKAALDSALAALSRAERDLWSRGQGSASKIAGTTGS